MEMEVVVMPVPAASMSIDFNFNFDSACSSPYMTAPSSPQRFGSFLITAPTASSRISAAFYRDLNNTDLSSLASSSSNREDGEDFEFDFSGQLERTSLSADELFDGGKIRPLKPPTTSDSRNSSQKKDLDRPSMEEVEETQMRREFKRQDEENLQQKRGRERSFSSSTSRKGSRSLSPVRVSDIISSTPNNNSTTATPKSYASTFLSAISFSKNYYRKWRLKDLLLFRSASEGRAAGNVPLRTKYAALSKKETEDVRNASFRSTESSGSVTRRRGPPVSAHELHYTENRAVAEEMKRKTFLPYKQGLLGCLGFNPGGVHAISRGVGSLTRG